MLTFIFKTIVLSIFEWPLKIPYILENNLLGQIPVGYSSHYEHLHLVNTTVAFPAEMLILSS